MADLDRDQMDEQALASALQLRGSILQQLGLVFPLLVPLGCSGISPSDGDDGGVTTNPSSGGSGPDTADTLDSAEESGDSTGQDTSDIKLDLPPDPGLSCTQEWLTAGQVAEQYPDCDFGPGDPLWMEYSKICVQPSDGQTCDDICADGFCEGMESCWWNVVATPCGVFEDQGACCSVVASEPLPPVGRPFIVAGEARLAQVDCAELDSPLAAHWLEMARGEHASIAAFARFVALLQRQAAPARLVADALAAASDEARHTGDALKLASRFAGRACVLGGLSVTGTSTETLAEAVRAAVLEGCIGETLAAHEAACLAAFARDEAVAAVLTRIASDEARHAGLAWRFVAWTLEAHPELRPVVEAAFATAQADHPSADPARGDTEGLLAFGCPSPTRRARWRKLAINELIRPCAARLV